MGRITVVDVPRRGFSHAPLTDEQITKLVEGILNGEAMTLDDVSFPDRRYAQTEAWWWRQEIARRCNLLVSDLKSATFTDDNGETYRFAIYSISKIMSAGRSRAGYARDEGAPAP